MSADELVPLPDGRFAIAGDAMGMQMRFTFDAGTPSPRLTVDRPDGTRRTFARKSRGAE